MMKPSTPTVGTAMERLLFLTDGRWAAEELSEFFGMLDAMYTVIASIIWIRDVTPTRGFVHRDAFEIATSILDAPDPTANLQVERNQVPERFLLPLEVERLRTFDAPALAGLRAARVPVPSIEIAGVSMHSPGWVLLLGAPLVIREMRQLIRDIWYRNKHESRMAKIREDVALELVQRLRGASSTDEAARITRGVRYIATGVAELQLREGSGQLRKVDEAIDETEPPFSY
jgi:hypothetical protein